ncbi:MAG: hypothetical protein BWX47_02036 [candidate division Hyd24-12 bacterium ADurb.Bin004]|nr:MAG: hypothetical protein BWX47_02036 [candidate division Hyd24-12 bacterium ADurb.Bin004]
MSYSFLPNLLRMKSSKLSSRHSLKSDSILLQTKLAAHAAEVHGGTPPRMSSPFIG